MAVDIYWAALLVLLPSATLLIGKDVIFRLFRRLIRRENKNHGEPLGYSPEKTEEAKKFRRTFLQVYLLVMSGEWLQGPYLYTLLRDEKALDERTVALLYAALYIAAALTALVAGFLADRYGRRLACVIFCVLHPLGAVSILSDRIEILYIGRVLAGVCLTLLWTVFESWMVTEFNARGLHQGSVSLSSTFGIMTTSNCVAAILSGVLGQGIVLASGSTTDPFLAGVILEVTGLVLLLRTWNENFGKADPNESHVSVRDPRSGTLRDVKVWILSYAICSFEGATFLVLFFWPGLLKEAHLQAHPDGAGELPYGAIFSSFMAAIMLGACTFRKIIQDKPVEPSDARRGVVAFFKALVAPHMLLAIALLVAGTSLLLIVCVPHETGIYMGFLVFELCNGVYLPSIAYQRGLIINPANRAGLYGLMQLPLYIFVVVALCTTGENAQRRRTVLTSCFVVLLTAALASALGLRPKPQENELAGTKLEECGDSRPGSAGDGGSVLTKSGDGGSVLANPGDGGLGLAK